MSKNIISVEVANQLMTELEELGFVSVSHKRPNQHTDSNAWVNSGPDSHRRLVKNGYGIWFYKVEDGARRFAVVGGGKQEWSGHNITDEKTRQQLVAHVVDLAERSGVLETKVKAIVAQVQDVFGLAGIETYQTQVGQSIDLYLGKPDARDNDKHFILSIAFYAHRHPDAQMDASFANDRYSDFYRYIEDSTSALVKNFDDVIAGLTADAALSKPHRRQVEVGNSFVTMHQPSYFLFDMLARGLESVKHEMVEVVLGSADPHVAALLDSPESVYKEPKFIITFRS
ncbi:hypothetical protein LU11_gp270 [Pseudomonas phage Lu11]|uniref:hypothetical protein n=1 Tax=Pseudomonas phage Lu11 TaxID=1161927 RepID=UPI00025F1835|nr:hypothetical protein LU11_gp270 [Pseudomonas phage Lu11]AFH14801.1 hypothetical protein Lu11_0264 [Pseudomonas phage Lu11]